MRRIAAISFCILVGCNRPAGQVTLTDAAEYPLIAATPVRLFYDGASFSGRLLNLEFHRAAVVAGDPPYAFALMRGSSDSDYGRRNGKLELRDGWIFVNKCFKSPRPLDQAWPIIVGGRVSAGSDGSEFVMTVRNGEFEYLFYISSKNSCHEVHLKHSGNSSTATLSVPMHDYAYLDRRGILQKGDFSGDLTLLEKVNQAIKLAELAGVRCACRRCPASAPATQPGGGA